MNISSESMGRMLASARGYSQWAIGFGTSLGLVSVTNSKTLTESFAEVFNGISQVAHGVTSIWQVGVIVLGPIAGVALAKWSSNTAKTSSQATAVNTAVKEAIADPKSEVSLAVKAVVIDTAAVLPEVVANNPSIKVGDAVLANAVPSSNVVVK